MPIYEYRCSSCGFQKEYLQKVNDPVMSVCPECGRETFSKMLSAAGFKLKGSGWYATDFKNSGAKPAAKTEAKTEAKTDAKTGDKAAAKSDAKDSSTGKSDKKDSSPGKSGGNTESNSKAAA
jgi:putative FmdB family regulatory protein